MTDYLTDSTISKLARMVANSVAFQEEVAKYSEHEALAHVHRWLAIDPDALPRPFAIIAVEESTAEAGAGGAKDTFRNGETLTLWLSTEQDPVLEQAATLDWFWEWAKAVRNEILALSSEDDNLSIMNVTLDGPPTMSAETSGEETRNVHVIWRLGLRGYLVQ